MKAPLSPGQQKALGFIQSFISEKSLPPTSYEIADGLGISQTAATQYIKLLVSKGWITTRARGARSIVVLD